MNNEENTKEKAVEELANAMTEGMDAEVTTDEEKESPVEDAPVEDAPVEEEPAEEPAVEVPTKKSKKGLIITLSIVGALFIGIAATYLVISSYYKDRFVMGTNVNGVADRDGRAGHDDVDATR